MHNTRNVQLYLQDILEAIKNIGEYTRGLTYAGYIADKKTVDAVVHNLEIIGEAADNIPNDFTAEHEDIPWQKMVGMRNKMVHEYFGVDQGIIWQTIQVDLPPLRELLGELIKASTSGPFDSGKELDDHLMSL